MVEINIPQTHTRMVGVVGHPISHSLSPCIHRFWLQQLGITDADYIALDVPPEKLAETLHELPAKGFVGCNLTIPHKEDAFRPLKDLGAEAKEVRAANTLIFNAGKTRGENTDVYGFIQNLKSVGDLSPYKKHAVVIGAGGAARAAVVALGGEGWQRITLINRTEARAEAIKKDYPYAIEVLPWARRQEAISSATLLVNTTNQGMKGQPPLEISLEILPKNALVTDIVYNPLNTPLLAEAQKRGNKTIDGLGMLLYQAQAAFEMWFHVKPEVTNALRAHVLEGLGDQQITSALSSSHRGGQQTVAGDKT